MSSVPGTRWNAWNVLVADSVRVSFSTRSACVNSRVARSTNATSSPLSMVEVTGMRTGSLIG